MKNLTLTIFTLLVCHAAYCFTNTGNNTACDLTLAVGNYPLAVIIYDDAISSQFGAGGGWGGSTTDFENDENVHEGTKSIKVDFEGFWGGGAQVGTWGNDPLSTEDTKVFVFSIFGGAGTQGKSIQAALKNNTDEYFVLVEIEEGNWKDVEIPLSELGNIDEVTELFFQDTDWSGTVYIDRIGFSYSGGTKEQTITCGESITLPTPRTNYTGTGEITYNWSPETGLSDPTVASPTAQITESTEYVLEATDPDGCTATDTIIINVTPLSVSLTPTLDIICGEEVQLPEPIINTEESLDLSYNWSPGVGLSDSTISHPSVLTTETREYTLEITTPNGCSAKDTVTVNVSPMAINLGPDLVASCGETLTLPNFTTNLPGAEVTYNWSPTTGLSDPTISNPTVDINETISYTLEVTNTEGCTASDDISIIRSVVNFTPSICMTTVNEEEHNEIIIKDNYPAEVDSFLIFRESSITDVFDLIGTIGANEQVFVDTESDASVQSNIYKIAAFDQCGETTTNSSVHKTMHLTINKGTDNDWNLIWEPYQGITVSTYNIYRGSTVEELELIGNSSGNNTSYTDKNAPSGSVFYQLEIVFPEACTVSGGGDRLSPSNYTSSKSNIASSRELGLILSESETKKTKSLLYPNPASDKLRIFNSSGLIKSLSIYDAAGKKVKLLINPEAEIDITDLSSGLYYVTINDGYHLYHETLMVNKN